MIGLQTFEMTSKFTQGYQKWHGAIRWSIYDITSCVSGFRQSENIRSNQSLAYSTDE